jgi:hypothetical protein
MKRVLLIGLLTSAAFYVCGQQVPAGMLVRFGMCYGVGSSSVNPPPAYLSASVGAFRYFAVRQQEHPSFSLVHVRAEFSTGFYKGYFRNDAGQLGQLTNPYFNLSLLVPFTSEINDHLSSHIGLGVAAYAWLNQTVTSDQLPMPVFKKQSPVSAGWFFDYHLVFSGTSHALAGTAVHISPTSEYSYMQWSIYFGMSVGRRKR